jgi:hypothetical protein
MAVRLMRCGLGQLVRKRKVLYGKLKAKYRTKVPSGRLLRSRVFSSAVSEEVDAGWVG